MLCYTIYFEKYFQFKYILTHIWMNTILNLNANCIFEWNATPSLGPNINRFFTVFLIKKSDQLPFPSQLFTNYINSFAMFIFKIHYYYYTELL